MKATFGAGCFWSVEVAFRNLKGVKDAPVGYMGGHIEGPTYHDVCSHKTGHAEVVEVEYDPDEISYEELLEAFFSNHDPTQYHRQGPDIGSQYRSIIFYYNDEQKTAAEQAIKDIGKSSSFKRPIVTEVKPAKDFWRAEEYHQRYLEKKGLATCRV